MNQPLPAPEIPGLSFEGKLGAGGYADVFLYSQHMPSRKVAVKVMREAGLTPAAVARFGAEANAMARLEHPHIVPVYAAGATPDGRPYLVMMYYPKASLAARVRSGPLPIPEVLRIGIQIGSAVETAHRAGLLHRDIKPANVLTNQYGTPGLTDFGIAARIAEVDDDDLGVSVPWSPPEVLYATSPGSARSDVYSLAATLWHLLVGRSPFELPGGDNSTFALMKRIRDLPVPSTGRPGVPTSLDRLLRSAMAKDPVARPASALDFARSLQAIEQELRYPRTPLVVAEHDVGESPVREGQDETRVRAAQVVQPAPGLPALAPAPAWGEDPGTRLRGATPLTQPEVAGTRARAAQPSSTDQEEAPERRVAWPVVLLAVAATVAVVVVGFWLASSQPRAATTPATTTAVHTPQVGGDALPPGPLTFTSSTNGDEVTFSWDGYAHQLDSDTYTWRPAGDSGGTEVSEPSVTVEATDGLCIEVKVNRADGSFRNAGFQKGCLP